MPLLGKVMELGGVVFIDRADGKSAINAIAPLVNAMRNEGKSVVLAPEGTRSTTDKLAPFKKGAFHLAMQAGVPMVPIVIHNSTDVAPKGDFVFRPATVEIEVLPPVNTSSWAVESLNTHVREVRNMFARALGQAQENTPKPRSKKAAKVGPKKVSAKTKTKVRAKTKAKTRTTVKKQNA